MKHPFKIALLAFAILAACGKDEIKVIPDVNPPPPPPPPPPPGQVWADTGYKNPVELGSVSPPCIYVSTFDVLTQEYSVYKYNLEGTKREQVIDPGPLSGLIQSAPGFTPRGEFMVFSDREGLHMQDMRTNLTSLICNVPGREIWQMQFSPDEGKLAFNAIFAYGPVYGFGDLCVVDTRPGATPVNLTKSGNEVLSVPAFSPDGKRIAYTSAGVLYVTDLEGKQKTKIQGNNANAYGVWAADPIYTRDGRQIIYTSDTGQIAHSRGEIFATSVAEGATDAAVKLTEAREYGLRFAYRPVLGPDGTLYFLGETYTGLVHLYARSVNGGPFRMVTPCVSWDDVDTRITFVDR